MSTEPKLPPPPTPDVESTQVDSTMRIRTVYTYSDGAIHAYGVQCVRQAASATEKAIFEWLCRKYVQRSDEGQKAMGLQYTTAETHDLARELASWLAETPLT